MAETVDDLSAPLGQEMARRNRRYRLPFTGPQALAVMLGLFLVVFVGFAIFNDDPLGGEPVAHVALRAPKDGKAEEKPGAAAASEQVAKAGAKQGRAADQKTVTIIDGSSGSRQDVVISGEAPDKADTDAYLAPNGKNLGRAGLVAGVKYSF